MLPEIVDPLNDRVLKTEKAPPHKYFEKFHLFANQKNKTPDWKRLLAHLKAGGRVSEDCCIYLINEASSIFKSEGNILEVDEPAVCVGDIHGQFYDLLKIFELGGNPDTCNYIFIGDYVDRGNFSVEVVLLLYCIKIHTPKTFIMLRGNHESRQLAEFFNFEKEVKTKYNPNIFDLFIKSFNNLPLGCILNHKILVIHGGLSPEFTTLAQLRALTRISEPPKSGLFCDILWSDPVENDKGDCTPPYKHNSVRGCSYYFGKEATNIFLKKNGLISVIRGHEAQIEGYKMHKWNGEAEFPPVITIFSAANYCDAYNNKGAIIKFGNNTLNIQQFANSPHPYILPNFMDVFSWATPFLAEKVTEMFDAIFNKTLNPKGKMEDENSANEKTEALAQLDKEKAAKITSIKNKIMTVSKMVKLFRILRIENEDIIKLKGLCPDNKIPKGLVIEGAEAIKKALTATEAFNRMKNIDKINEGLPEVISKKIEEKKSPKQNKIIKKGKK